jgi:ParB-like chromosome segregation protein Spo0J
MIESHISLVPLSSIDFPESRQRQEINFDKVYEYATSIAQQGLIQDIGVNADGMTLVWGGHRYTAFSLCNAVYFEDETAITANYTEEQISALNALLHSATKDYDFWSKIPAKLIKDASPLLLSVLELSENLNRHDLSWQEKASAVETIHKQAVADARERRELWVDADTARIIGCSRELVSQLLTPTRKLAAITDPKIKEKAQAALKDSKSALSASNAVETIAQRHGVTTNAAMNLGTQEKAQQTKKEEKPVIVSASLGQRSILCADFNEWAASYEGPKFNFVHCDFPYGVDFNKATGMNTSAATHSVGEYDDGEEVYWKLLSTLISKENRLIEPSAHIMFWLSVGESKIYKEPMFDITKRIISEAWPDAHISSLPLIWHCSDNSGLLPDSRREPRRTYEWAIKITLGDRPIAKPVAASFSYPRNTDLKIHRSQKHQAVLQHFFQLFVDSSSRMLDPTCGSGTSVLTAHMMKAESVLGLELDPEMRESAVKNFDEVLK